MLTWAVRRSLAHRRAIAVVALAVLLSGLWQVRHVKVDALPEFSPPTVEVQTEALGLSAEEVEQLVTTPLEKNFLNGMPFLDTIRSRSVPGLSSVVMTFQPSTDLFTARQLVQERLSLTTELPNVSKPPQMLQAVSASSRVLTIGLSTHAVSAIQMSVLAKFVIGPRLLGVPGVASVSIYGQRDLQLQVQVDPQKLVDKKVSLDQIITTTGNALFVSPLTFLEASTPGSGGFFETPNQRLSVQHILPISTPAELARVSVAEASSPLRLSDVATVVQDHQPLIGDAALKSGPGLLVVVDKLPGANTIDVTKRIDDALDTLAPGLKGITIDRAAYRPASFIRSAEHNITTGAVIGALLAIVALAVLFLDWRAAAVTFGTAALALLAATYVLYLRGTTINAFVLAGLVAAVGIAIHDSVAVVAALPRRRADGDATAAIRVGRPLAYASLITLVAMAPVLFLARLPSKPFLTPAAVASALALGASLLVSLTVAPALAALVRPVGPRRAGTGEAATVAALRRGAAATLSRFAARPAIVALAVVALVVLGIGSVVRLSPTLRPTLRETSLVVQWDGPAGTSLGEMTRVLNRAATELRSVRGVRNVGVEAGRAIGSDQVVGVSSGQLLVALDPHGDYEAAVAAVRNVVDGYPGLAHNVLSYFNDRVREVQDQPDQPVVVRLQGDDPAVLNAKAAEVRAMLRSVPGVTDPQVEVQPKQPTIQVEVNLAEAELHGLKPGDIRRSATTLVEGLDVGSLYQDQKVFQVVVVGQPSLRHSLTTIRDMVIDTPDGTGVRLRDVADVRIGPSLSVIKHDNTSRSLDVTAGVKGRGVSAAVLDVRRRLEAMRFPLGHNATVLGDYAAQDATHRGLLGVAAVVAVLVLLLFQAAFASWRTSALALVSLPIAVSGGAVAAWADSGHLSLGALIGLFGVAAIAIHGSTALFAQVARLDASDSGRGVGGTAPVERAASDRAVPVLIAAIVTALALAPFVALGAEPGTEILRPMAIVILGGLVTTTLVTLVLLPAAELAVRRRRSAPAAPGSTLEEGSYGVP